MGILYFILVLVLSTFKPCIKSAIHKKLLFIKNYVFQHDAHVPGSQADIYPHEYIDLTMLP